MVPVALYLVPACCAALAALIRYGWWRAAAEQKIPLVTDEINAWMTETIRPLPAGRYNPTLREWILRTNNREFRCPDS